MRRSTEFSALAISAFAIAALLLCPVAASAYSKTLSASTSQTGGTVRLNFQNLPGANTNPSLKVGVSGDFSSSREFARVRIDGSYVGIICRAGCADCRSTKHYRTYTLSPSDVSDGQLTVTVDTTSDVNICTTRVEATLSYDIGSPPSASDVSVTTNEDTPASVSLKASDPDGDSLTYKLTSQPSHGWTSGFDPLTGKLTYTPNRDYNGPDSFTWEVSDGNNAPVSAKVSVTVNPVADAPRFVTPTPSGTVMAKEAKKLTFELKAVDADGDTLSYSVGSMPSGATFDAMTRKFSWTPSFQDVGQHTVNLKVTDGQNSDTRSVTIAVSFVDKDGDGLPDTWESQNGLDGSKTDSDGDGLSDGTEIGDWRMPNDTDGDGKLDGADLDSDGDTVKDAKEAGPTGMSPVDTDGDGTADFRDTDSDGDGVGDMQDNCRTTKNQAQADADGDGTGDACDDDIDGDGLSNAVEKKAGLDPTDSDSDDDNISDGDEYGSRQTPANFDGDSDIDALDGDSDNDGLTDKDEAGDADPSTPPVDTDGDGKADYRDDDSDDDGVADGNDNCRLVENRAQTDTDGDGTGDACTDDKDGDGVEDSMDNCPTVANMGQMDFNMNGTGDACDDTDHDGVSDDKDNCPETANQAQQDSDGDGTGDACQDSDGDGIPDTDDDCPNQSAPTNDGCPTGPGDTGTPADTGTLADTGTPDDTGTLADTGMMADAGIGDDAVTATDASTADDYTTRPDDEGCGCRQGSPTPRGAPLLAALLLGTLLLRRREGADAT